MPEPAILYEKQDGHVVLVTMNRPEALNAMNREFFRLMEEALYRFNDDDDAWVLILTGAGRAFCAGRDLKERAADMAAGVQPRPTVITYPEVLKPMIAAINGPAIAGGWMQAQICDIRVAADTAVLGIAEAHWNLLAPFAPALVGQIPHAALMEILLTARPITAQRAYEIGFINRVVPAEQLLPVAYEYARAICENAPLAVRAAKEVVLRAIGQPPAAVAAHVYQVYERLLKSEDAVEGPRAFAERRPPVWKGR
jgi:enoyl-CoA hydratase/carnithine racemase